MDEIWESSKRGKKFADDYYERLYNFCVFFAESIKSYLGCRNEDCEYSGETQVVDISKDLTIPKPGKEPIPRITALHHILKMSFIRPDGYKIPIQFELWEGQYKEIWVTVEGDKQFRISEKGRTEEINPLLDATYTSLSNKAFRLPMGFA